MKYLLLSISLLALTTEARAVDSVKKSNVNLDRSPASNSEVAVTCPPRSDDTDGDNDKVSRLILQQKDCDGAVAVFDKCHLGNTYNLADLTESLMGVCEKSIAKKPKINKLYMATIKLCAVRPSPGGERQQIARENQCRREVTRVFNMLSELNYDN